VITNIIASQRPWNADLADRLTAKTGVTFVTVSDEGGLSLEAVTKLKPKYIFIIHWSNNVPDEVWSTQECVVFHMTDVPYGRGGSPLQNLIARGHDSTSISALRCVRELDAGPVYFKRPLCLHGSAEEIFLRADRIIEEMIVEIVNSQPTPVPQQGEPVVFRRRRPDEGDLSIAQDLDGWYHTIRMLDAEGYPRAYLDIGDFRIEFSRVDKRVAGLVADVTIRRRSKESKRGY
jgi:methionyl-tRNA formyltransferase